MMSLMTLAIVLALSSIATALDNIAKAILKAADPVTDIAVDDGTHHTDTRDGPCIKCGQNKKVAP